MKLQLKDFKNYIGDVNPEYGGAFYNLEGWKHGYIDALVVTDLDSGCGFNGAVMIEKVTVYGINEPDKIHAARQCCGCDKVGSIRGLTSNDRKLFITETLRLYGCYELEEPYYNPTRVIIQCDSDRDYAPMRFDGWVADHRLKDGIDLFDYLLAEGWLSEFE